MSYSELKYSIENNLSIGCCQACRYAISKTKVIVDSNTITDKAKKFRIIRYQSSDEFLDKLKSELDSSNITFKEFCRKNNLSYTRMNKLFRNRYPDYDLFYSSYKKKILNGVGFADPKVQERCKSTQKELGTAFYSEEVRLRGINTQKENKSGIFNREFHSNKLQERFKVKYSSIKPYFESLNLKVNFEYPLDVNPELVDKYHKEYYFFDIYVPDLNLLIELDGSIHHSSYKDQMEADKLKEEFAISNGYDFLRISDPTNTNTPFPIELLDSNTYFRSKVHRLSSSEE